MTKVWFITGAGNGVGAAMARTVLKFGGKVVAAGPNIETVRSALQDVAGENLALVRLDGRDETGAQDAVRYALNVFGRIDVLFNNAGYRLLGDFETLTIREIEGVVSANLFEVIYIMRAVLPVMRGQGSGRIISMSSVAGLMGLKCCSAYGAAMFALEGLSQAVAQDVEPFGIRITTVAPGLSGFGGFEHRDGADTGGTVAESADLCAADLYAQGHNPKLHGDAEGLSYVLLTIAQMKDPPRQFVADGDSLHMYKPVLTRQRDDLSANEALSRSMSEPLLIEQFRAVPVAPTFLACAHGPARSPIRKGS
jgi:NAD(P)-dependent dehydrogenase (short-subunit alcohol dehydrogenase family)